MESLHVSHNIDFGQGIFLHVPTTPLWDCICQNIYLVAFRSTDPSSLWFIKYGRKWTWTWRRNFWKGDFMASVFIRLTYTQLETNFFRRETGHYAKGRPMEQDLGSFDTQFVYYVDNQWENEVPFKGLKSGSDGRLNTEPERKLIHSTRRIQSY